MVATAWRLGADPAYAALGLRRHAHTLGYGGHFLSKSRRYSTTFAALRAARAEWRTRRHGGVLPSDTAVESRWELVGVGWANRGEEPYAEHQRRQRADERRAAADDRSERGPEPFN